MDTASKFGQPSEQPLARFINVFDRQFRDGSLLAAVEQALTATCLDPASLTLEFSQAVIFEDLGYSFALLTSLKAFGVRISIDDFATGHISLPALKRLPIDELKIDRQFIDLIDRDESQHAIVDSIMDIAANFGCDVVAKGIERQAQLDKLATNSCLRVQGFLFSKAISANEVERFVEGQCLPEAEFLS